MRRFLFFAGLGVSSFACSYNYSTEAPSVPSVQQHSANDEIARRDSIYFRRYENKDNPNYVRRYGDDFPFENYGHHDTYYSNYPQYPYNMPTPSYPLQDPYYDYYYYNSPPQ